MYAINTLPKKDALEQYEVVRAAGFLINSQVTPFHFLPKSIFLTENEKSILTGMSIVPRQSAQFEVPDVFENFKDSKFIKDKIESLSVLNNDKDRLALMKFIIKTSVKIARIFESNNVIVLMNTKYEKIGIDMWHVDFDYPTYSLGITLEGAPTIFTKSKKSGKTPTQTYTALPGEVALWAGERATHKAPENKNLYANKLTCIFVVKPTIPLFKEPSITIEKLKLALGRLTNGYVSEIEEIISLQGVRELMDLIHRPNLIKPLDTEPQEIKKSYSIDYITLFKAVDLGFDSLDLLSIPDAKHFRVLLNDAILLMSTNNPLLSMQLGLVNAGTSLYQTDYKQAVVDLVALFGYISLTIVPKLIDTYTSYNLCSLVVNEVMVQYIALNTVGKMNAFIGSYNTPMRNFESSVAYGKIAENLGFKSDATNYFSEALNVAHNYPDNIDMQYIAIEICVRLDGMMNSHEYCGSVATIIDN